MNVHYNLAAFRPSVYYKTIALFRNASTLGNALGNGQHAAHERHIVFGKIGNRINVLFGYNENMYWGLGMDIVKSDKIVIPINYITRNFASYYRTKDSGHDKSPNVPIDTKGGTPTRRHPFLFTLIYQVSQMPPGQWCHGQ